VSEKDSVFEKESLSEKDSVSWNQSVVEKILWGCTWYIETQLRVEIRVDAGVEWTRGGMRE
jgi:hypothetical protein